MSSSGYEWDLVVLVADKNMESAIKGILTRPYDLGIYPIKSKIFIQVAEKALREVRKPRSSAIYEQLAQRISFGCCTDPAFEKFRNTLRKWFPLEVTR